MSALQCTLVAVLLSSLAAGEKACTDKQYSVERELTRDLLRCGYYSEHRPVSNHENTVQVQIAFAFRYYTFSALEETITVASTAAMTWHDEYLHWDPTDYENIESVLLEAEKIWTPNVELFNAVGEAAAEWGLCNITNKGQVSCTPELEHTALCATNLRAWPHDTLTCNLYFGNWINTGEQVNYTLLNSTAAISIDACKDGPGWNLLDAKSSRMPNELGNSSFPILIIALKFVREAAAEVCGASGVGTAVALLPLAATMGGGARLPLAMFAVAAHMFALNELSWSLPRHGTTSPRLLLACRTSLLVAAAGVLAALLLAWLRARPASAPPPPRALATLVRLASATPVNHFVFADLDSERQILAEDESDPEATGSQWRNLANLLDGLLCIIALIIYAVLVFW